MQPQLDEGAHKLSPGLQHRTHGARPCVCRLQAYRDQRAGGGRTSLIESASTIVAWVSAPSLATPKCSSAPIIRAATCAAFRPRRFHLSARGSSHSATRERSVGVAECSANVAKSWADVAKSGADVAKSGGCGQVRGQCGRAFLFGLCLEDLDERPEELHRSRRREHFHRNLLVGLDRAHLHGARKTQATAALGVDRVPRAAALTAFGGTCFTKLEACDSSGMQRLSALWIEPAISSTATVFGGSALSPPTATPCWRGAPASAMSCSCSAAACWRSRAASAGNDGAPQARRARSRRTRMVCPPMRRGSGWSPRAKRRHVVNVRMRAWAAPSHAP